MLTGGKEWLARLSREEAEVMELVGPGRFRISTADGSEEVAGDHWLIVGGCLLIRSPQGNDLRCWAAGAWNGVELVG